MVATTVRAVFVDLDGTLLNKDHALSDLTRDVLARLRRARPEVKLVVVTGRPHPHVLKLMSVLGLQPDYIVSNNGAVGHHGETRECIFAHSLPVSTVHSLLRLPLPTSLTADGNAEVVATAAAEVPVVAANLFRAEEWVTTAMVAGLGASYRLGFHPRVECDVTTREELWGDVYGFFFYGPHELLRPLEATLQQRFADSVSVAFSLPFILDVGPAGVDKGSAVRDVLARLQLRREDSIAFGDGMNDLAMLQAVGRGYVMANAAAELMAALPAMEVIGHHEDDGVARKLIDLYDL
ncbi:Sucrose-6F-phosphate phosphohydrolase/haloacid dehalogenase-like hydrolase [Novymonas esmeraldas]|uniref:Sucrose-6F-phosphate phosphohydrolase/haloacid dehalogenase-like hydrolase n=1 Tax=Novymonas esmeraldas TaxID=1808958 RepID=A0AAW0ET97_9TRYP